MCDSFYLFIIFWGGGGGGRCYETSVKIEIKNRSIILVSRTYM